MLGILLNLLAEQVAGFFVFVTLPVEVHLAALETLVPVDLVTIKVRAVDAGELGLAADGEAPPHMPVPSTMIGLMETVVGMP